MSRSRATFFTIPLLLFQPILDDRRRSMIKINLFFKRSHLCHAFINRRFDEPAKQTGAMSGIGRLSTL
jgi:hypothetical protein